MPIALDSVVPQKATTVFEQAKKQFDLHPLRDPFNLLEGAIWVGFLGLSLVFSGSSLKELYNELTVESASTEKNAKVRKAVKSAFVDLVSLGGSTIHTLRFASEAKVISLGKYAPVMKVLGFGASLVINLVEGGWDLYNIALENGAMSKARTLAQKEQHKQKLCISLLKLIGNVCMVAWSALGIAAAVAALAVSPALMTILLVAGCVCPITAFFYQQHIEKTATPAPVPIRAAP
jgi:hypothetical protein